MSRRGTRGWFLRRILSTGSTRWALRAVWRRGPAVDEIPAVERGPLYEWVPAQPLLDWVSRYGGPRLAAADLGVGADLPPAKLAALERAYHRGMQLGRFTVYAADELAIRLLGWHPAEIWGAAWWDPSTSA